MFGAALSRGQFLLFVNSRGCGGKDKKPSCSKEQSCAGQIQISIFQWYNFFAFKSKRKKNPSGRSSPMKKITLFLLLGLLVVLAPTPLAHAQANKFEKINHVIILYLENHTVDNLYSGMPGVNGINSPGGAIS